MKKWNKLLWGGALYGFLLTGAVMVGHHAIEVYDWQWWNFGLLFYAICIVWLGS